MHIDFESPRIASLKEFAKHYLMIVLSILTALGLEAWIEHVHHTHAAELARQRMDRELSIVLTEIDNAVQMDERSLSKLKSLDAMIASDLSSGVDSREIVKKILARKDDYTLNTSWPSLPTSAWDVAVADQSIGWLDAADLRRYAEAYTAERSLHEWLLHDSIIIIDAPRMLDIVTDLKMNRPVEPYVVLRSLRQMEVLLDNTIAYLRNTGDEVKPAGVGAAPPA